MNIEDALEWFAENPNRPKITPESLVPGLRFKNNEQTITLVKDYLGQWWFLRDNFTMFSNNFQSRQKLAEYLVRRGYEQVDKITKFILVSACRIKVRLGATNTK
jgi:hypothetical protein